MQKAVTQKEVLISYSINSEVAGDKRNVNVPLIEAAKDIFKHVKEKAMQCAIKGEFIQFSSIKELQEKLSMAAQRGFAIHCYDEDIGG